jgi:hypothetical protein
MLLASQILQRQERHMGTDMATIDESRSPSFWAGHLYL